MVQRHGEGASRVAIDQVDSANRRISRCGELKHGTERDLRVDEQAEENDRNQQNPRLAVSSAQVHGQDYGDDDREKNDIGEIADELHGEGCGKKNGGDAAIEIGDAGQDEKGAPAQADTLMNEGEIEQRPEIG